MTSPEVPVTVEERMERLVAHVGMLKNIGITDFRRMVFDQLQAAREDALEEAAKVAEHCEYHGSDCCACTLLARQIRALKAGGL